MKIETIADRIEEIRNIVGKELGRVDDSTTAEIEADRATQLSVIAEVLGEAWLLCRHDWQQKASYRSETIGLANQKRAEN